MKTQELEELFKTGMVDFSTIDKIEIGNEVFSTYRDFSTLIDVTRNINEITYISDNNSHLIFEYIKVEGNIIANRIYIKDKDTIKEEAKREWDSFMLRESKIIKRFNDL